MRRSPAWRVAHACSRATPTRALAPTFVAVALTAPALAGCSSSEDDTAPDPRGDVALAFRGFPANVVPFTILLDEQGNVAAVYTGAGQEVDLCTALDTLLQESGS